MTFCFGRLAFHSNTYTRAIFLIPALFRIWTPIPHMIDDITHITHSSTTLDFILRHFRARLWVGVAFLVVVLACLNHSPPEVLQLCTRDTHTPILSGSVVGRGRHFHRCACPHMYTRHIYSHTPQRRLNERMDHPRPARLQLQFQLTPHEVPAKQHHSELKSLQHCAF